MHSPDEARKRRLDALASDDVTNLAKRYAALEPSAPAATPIRGPEIGMVMLRGAIFNLGEATVTRANVKLATGEVGHAIVLGRHLQKASIVAHLDALSQLPDWVQVIETDLGFGLVQHVHRALIVGRRHRERQVGGGAIR